MNPGTEPLPAAAPCEPSTAPELHSLLTLVQHCADLINELQRERGLSKLYLASHGERFAAALREQVLLSQEAEQGLRLCRPPSVDAIDSAASGSAGLDTLAVLRQRVQLLACSSAEAIEGYARLIVQLLARVAAAAAAAIDPGFARRLTALLHLMQGKEYAGQERAIGAALFARGRHDAGAWQRISERIALQQDCFARFTEFASLAACELWQVCQQVSTLAELERLRQLLARTQEGAPLDTGLCEVWFACCSRRMNEIREFECRLLAELQQDCPRAGVPATGGTPLFSLH